MGDLGIQLKDPGKDILDLWIVFLGDAKKKSQVFYNCSSILLQEQCQNPKSYSVWRK